MPTAHPERPPRSDRPGARRARFRGIPLVVGALALLALPAGAGSRSGSPPPTERRATIFFTGAVHGSLEPCGCTSDPLGDVARMTGMVRRAQKETGAVLLVDAGNLTYAPEPLSKRRQEAADLKARFLAAEVARLPFGGAALGEGDLVRGPEQVLPKRLVANGTGAAFIVPSRIQQVGAIKVGILGVSAPEVLRRAGLKAEDPAEAARREAERLRREGAEVVIALAALERAGARRVARSAPVDFVVVGQSVGDGLERAEAVGSAFLVAPAVEMQKIGRIDLVLRGDGARPGLLDAGSAEGQALEKAEVERKVKDLELEISRWIGDKAADAAFVAGRRKELGELRARAAALATASWKAPESGSYFSSRLIPLRRVLPRDPALASAMKRLDKQMGQASLKFAEAPPKAEPGRASFVGDAACASCHKQEMAFWKTTVHAKAWKTLVVGGKTLQEDCVSCHVTGFGEVGGSALGFVARLEAVQCETCHGPGSLHVAAEGLEDPMAVRLDTPESTCIRCHNEKHSDTFQYTAYLRDVLGPGHGEAARTKLGPGPTGRELRAAAAARAKAAGAAQVQKM